VKTNKKHLFLVIFILLVSCKEGNRYDLLTEHKLFVEDILSNEDSFYYLSCRERPENRKTLAIGIFDSGIGGLAVLDAIIKADNFNLNRENKPDGIQDFLHEQFVFFADLANMPYSNYVETGKESLLREHILKDALFLINNRSYQSIDSEILMNNKPYVKTIVIACNTATAYGKASVEELCEIIKAEIKIIGIIDAGCAGALDVFDINEDGMIAVLATPATVSSRAYVSTLEEGIHQRKYKGEIQIIQQGGKGLHESIDNKSEFIDNTASKPRSNYLGPSFYHEQYKIDKNLLPVYNFDTTDMKMIYNKTYDDSDTMQINAVENYVRYHIINLVEKIRIENEGLPLKAIILGCTHYSYVSEEIIDVLDELRQSDRYKNIIAEEVVLVDPAKNVAIELYKYLSGNHLLNDSERNMNIESLFYISKPNIFEPGVKINSEGKFTYEYQYSEREINELINYTMIVPFSDSLISDEQADQIRTKIPATYKLIKDKAD
jgi:glutamate racemase